MQHTRKSSAEKLLGDALFTAFAGRIPSSWLVLTDSHVCGTIEQNKVRSR